MDKKIKVILTQRWWDDNRAKTLIDKGNLGKALKFQEGAFGLAVVAKGIDKVERLKAAEAACKAISDAAAVTAKACVNGVHGDTQWVLKNSFPKAVEDQEKKLQKIRSDFESELAALTVEGVYKDLTLRPLLAKLCKKQYSMENLEFLMVAHWGGKRDDATYDAFIPKSSARQVNISSAAFDGLADAKKAGKLKSSPAWDLAVTDVMSLMRRDILPRLSKAILDGTI